VHYHWDFSGLVPYAPAFIRGIAITLELTILSSAIGTLAGAPLAAMLRLGGIIAVPTAFLIDVVRAIPNLVLIFFFYYFPYEQLLGVPALPGFSAVLWALVLAQAAYSADLFRGAVDQLPRGQLMGIQAIGFKRFQVLRFMIIPSVAKQVFPGHLALWIGNLKLTSLASVIGVGDVVFVARIAMSQTFRSLEAWTVVAVIYCVLVLPLTYGIRHLEQSAWIRRQ